MKLMIAASMLLASVASAVAAPPANCAGKFVGQWSHTGGNKAYVTADGRAKCTDHAFCVAGEHTWTCSGNVFVYTNAAGTWNYTLAPDGRSMSVGSAVATRLGPVPASARARDLGSAAANVASDVLGGDRTPSAAPRTPAPAAGAKAAEKPAPKPDDGEKQAAAREAYSRMTAGEAAYKSAGEFSYGDRKRALSVAEGNFMTSAEKYHKAGDKVGEAKARHALAVVRAEDAKTPEHAPRAGGSSPRTVGNKPSKENCEQVGYINITIVSTQDPKLRAGLIRDREKLKALCR